MDKNYETAFYMHKAIGLAKERIKTIDRRASEINQSLLICEMLSSVFLDSTRDGAQDIIRQNEKTTKIGREKIATLEKEKSSILKMISFFESEIERLENA